MFILRSHKISTYKIYLGIWKPVTKSIWIAFSYPTFWIYSNSTIRCFVHTTTAFWCSNCPAVRIIKCIWCIISAIWNFNIWCNISESTIWFNHCTTVWVCHYNSTIWFYNKPTFWFYNKPTFWFYNKPTFWFYNKPTFWFYKSSTTRYHFSIWCCSHSTI